MLGPIKVRVTLELDEWHRLKERALAERRDPDNMAGYLIVSGLRDSNDEPTRELATVGASGTP